MEDDGLPQNICEDCIGKTLDMYNYVLQCQQSDLTLKNILKTREQNHKLQNEDIIKIDIKVIDVNNENDANIDINPAEINAEKSAHSEDTNDISIAEKIDLEDDIKESTDFYNKADLQTRKLNRQKIQKPSGPPYNCSKCKVSYKTLRELRDHRKQVKHARSRNHVCTVCNKSFSYSHLTLHMRTHTMEKPYECKICQMRFSLACNLRRHMMTHTGERPHKCELCGKGKKFKKQRYFVFDKPTS